MLINGPCKLIVELPGNKGHDQGSDTEETWHSNQKWSDDWPYEVGPQNIGDTIAGRSVVQVDDSTTDLVNLDGGINEKGQVEDAKANDLNGILQSKRIIHENILIDKSKDEERQVGRNRFDLRNGI
jgi:hypothetical protein